MWSVSKARALGTGWRDNRSLWLFLVVELSINQGENCSTPQEVLNHVTIKYLKYCYFIDKHQTFIPKEVKNHEHQHFSIKAKCGLAKLWGMVKDALISRERERDRFSSKRHCAWKTYKRICLSDKVSAEIRRPTKVEFFETCHFPVTNE